MATNGWVPTVEKQKEEARRKQRGRELKERRDGEVPVVVTLSGLFMMFTFSLPCRASRTVPLVLLQGQQAFQTRGRLAMDSAVSLGPVLPSPRSLLA